MFHFMTEWEKHILVYDMAVGMQFETFETYL